MNVLILTDFSKVAANAAEYALRFLENEPANFFLLNFETYNESILAGVEVEEKKGQAVKKLYQYYSQLHDSSKNEDHNFQALFSEDNLVNATRKFVEEKKIDLIVMGAAGKESHKNTILGNHTYDIIKKVKCNVLAIAEGSVYKKPRKILLPLDYSAVLDSKIFQIFKKPGLVHDSRVTVLEIGDNNHTPMNHDANRDLISGQLNANKLHFVETEEAAVYNEELLMEVQQKFDMIVLLGKNLSICDKLLHTKYGICTKISNKLPILVMHGKG